MLTLSRFRFAILLAVVGLLMLGIAAYSAPPPPAAQTTIYEVHLKSTFGDEGVRKMTIDGKYFRWEMNSPGMDLKLIKNADGLFLLGSRPFASKYPPGSKRESPAAIFPGPIGDVKAFLKSHNAKPLGKAVLNKKKCLTYQYTPTPNGWKCKLWVDAVTSMPVLLEMSGGKKASYTKATYTKYQLNTPVPASTFDLPKDKKVRAMPDLNAIKKKLGDKKPAAK